MSVIPTAIYAGSSSFFPGDTPFGFYDYDPDFVYDAEKVVDWCAKRLGYPILDVELHEHQIFAAFEEAITEYGAQVNSIASKDNLLNVLGIPTSSISLNGTLVGNSLSATFDLAKDYGSEAGTGGKLTLYTGSIQLSEKKQVYDLLTEAEFETGPPTGSNSKFTIRKIFYESPPSIVKYFDPYLGTGLGSQQMLDQFGWGSFSPPLNFLLMPVNFDLLRVQAIELNDEIRRAGYSFQLSNNRLRIFPIPRQEYTLRFDYTLNNENTPGSGQTGVVTDHSNIPYVNPVYKFINALGRQWIRRYTLALCMEVLGWIRSKYGNVPIPEGDTSLNGDALLSAAQADKQSLIEELRDLLDQYTKQAQLERKQAEAEALNNQMRFVPLKIYLR